MKATKKGPRYHIQRQERCSLLCFAPKVPLGEASWINRLVDRLRYSCRKYLLDVQKKLTFTFLITLLVRVDGPPTCTEGDRNVFRWVEQLVPPTNRTEKVK
jgi:hypothetical protein